jgi:hypothetical protein
MKDQQGRDMLNVSRLSARVDLIPLVNGRISIATAQLFGMQAKLYRKDAESKPNFQFVIDSLASKDTTDTTPLDLRINSLIIRNSRIKYDRLDLPATPGRLNPDHLALSNISAHIVLKTLSEDSLNVNIKRLSFKEQSGLKVDRLAFHYDGGRRSSTLHGLQLFMKGTRLQLGEVRATYFFRDDHFVMPSLQLTGSVQPSAVTLSDFACLQPALQPFSQPLNLSARFSAEGESFTLHQLAIGTDDGELKADIQGACSNCMHTPVWRATVNDLSLSANAVSDIKVTWSRSFSWFHHL